MRALLLCVPLATLPACCGTSPPPVTPAVTSCTIPAVPPPPVLDAAACGPQVCLSVPVAVALAQWIAAVKETALALTGCSSVKLEASGSPATPAAPDPVYPASAVYRAQADIIEKMNSLYPGVEVEVRWEPCDEENSYYQPWDHTIHLCTEMEAHPSAAVVFAAHEMGHAITTQLLSVGGEQEADELAALAMIKFDHRQELLDAALYYKEQADQDHIPGDPHPSNRFRAWEMACIEAGSEPDATGECRDLYQGLRVRWNARLATP